MLDHLDAPSEKFFNEGYAASSSGPDLERAELEQKLLQIQELEWRARQDSNLRPSDS